MKNEIKFLVNVNRNEDGCNWASGVITRKLFERIERLSELCTDQQLFTASVLNDAMVVTRDIPAAPKSFDIVNDEYGDAEDFADTEDDGVPWAPGCAYDPHEIHAELQELVCTRGCVYWTWVSKYSDMYTTSEISIRQIRNAFNEE
jgi:hypothetical protein